MKLTALGIDSRDFDTQRMKELRRDMVLVRNWLRSPSRAGGRGKICQAAATLDKLVTRTVPLTQYRGMFFMDLSVADKLLEGRVSSKYPCESWTPGPYIALEFVDNEGGSRMLIGFVMERKFSKNEIILDIDGLVSVVKLLRNELMKADDRNELHPSIMIPHLREFLKDTVSLTITAESLGEEEFLMHPRPYSAKDITWMKVDSVKAIEERHPNLWRLVNSNSEYTPRDIDGNWLNVKAGEIE